MKKLSILALAAILVVAFTAPTWALENEFGGYWRTRFFSQKYFTGHSNGDLLGTDADGAPVFAGDDTVRRVDTRTRLYYTAKINDNLKFVNKFEMNAVWGESEFVPASTLDVVDAAGATIGAVSVPQPQNSFYGDPGADGIQVKVKNSYADFDTGPVNWTVGVQPYQLFRSFAIDDDASGVIARWKILDNFVLAGSWLKNYEGGPGNGTNEDVDTYTLTGAFWFNENISIKPSFSWAQTAELNSIFGTGLLATDGGAGTTTAQAPFKEADIYTFGADFDMSFDNWGLWATAFMQSGSVKASNALLGGFPVQNDYDFKGWLAAVGGNVMLGNFDIHGEFIYTPGDDDPLDTDLDNVFTPLSSYYWSEIMGLGIFDNRASANAPGDAIFNLMAFNIGTTYKFDQIPLSLSADLWYATRDEDVLFTPNAARPDLVVGEKDLGTELDLKATYQLVEGLNLDVVGAYLWAGDATSLNGKNKKDPYEVGARLSLSF
jgi:hypothetical protein